VHDIAQRFSPLQPADVGDDVVDEPNVPEALLSMDNVVLLPTSEAGR
jgi:hypothetical protein